MAHEAGCRRSDSEQAINISIHKRIPARASCPRRLGGGMGKSWGKRQCSRCAARPDLQGARGTDGGGDGRRARDLGCRGQAGQQATAKDERASSRPFGASRQGRSVRSTRPGRGTSEPGAAASDRCGQGEGRPTTAAEDQRPSQRPRDPSERPTARPTCPKGHVAVQATPPHVRAQVCTSPKLDATCKCRGRPEGPKPGPQCARWRGLCAATGHERCQPGSKPRARGWP